MSSRYGLCLGIVGGLLPMAGYADPTVFPDGVSLDSGFNSTFGPLGTGTGAYLGSLNGGLVLYSTADSSGRANWDGGVTLMGDPVNILLAMTSDTGNTDRGTFAVWGESEFYGPTTNKPFFQVKSPENIAAFDSVNVTVTNGSLSVGGSPVLTAGGLNAALSTATPPTSAAWQAAYVPRGNVSNGAALATGGATASGFAASAYGDSSTSATGHYSHATGFLTSATGTSSFAFGEYVSAAGSHSFAQGAGSLATGMLSFASGNYSWAQSYGETVFGRYNKVEVSPNGNAWINTDALFRVGNGTDSGTTGMSDALTIRKNGEMTVTNKAWKANSSAPLADPVATDDSGGNALVVDGHTKLNGKVEISVPQGDISMGIYQ